MRLVLFLRSLGTGGTERQVCSLAKGLQAMGHDVCVAVFYRGGSFESDLAAAGVTILDLGKRGRWRNIGPVARLAAHVRRSDSQVLYSFLTPPNAISALIRPILAPVRVVWGVRSCRLQPSAYGRAGSLAMGAESALSNMAHMIITNSEAAKSFYISRGFPVQRTVAISNGIDVDLFCPSKEGRERWRRELDVGPGQPLVGMAARLDPLKDHFNFLCAAAHVASVRPDVQFVCVGDGPERYRKELQAFAHDRRLADRVRWVRARQDVAQLYSALDLHVLSSCSEGFPNVVAETMACEVTNVVTDVGDSARIVGDTGLVVPPRDPKALGDAIVTALAGRDLTAGKRSRHRVINNFDRSGMVSATESVLCELCDTLPNTFRANRL